jgi:hypothetical protein
VTLLFIEDCGIFWCSQRAALIDPHRFAVLFLGCTFAQAIYSLIREGFNCGAKTDVLKWTSILMKIFIMNHHEQ